MIHSLKYRADFAVRMDAKGKGIKWFDDEQLVKEAKC